MAGYGVDNRPLPATVAAVPGNDLTFTIVVIDFADGPLVGTGATIVATAGSENMAVDYSTDGVFICSLTDTQTTTLGAGSHDIVFRVTPSGGSTLDWVRGTLTLTTSSTVAPGGGVSYGVVRTALVGVS